MCSDYHGQPHACVKSPVVCGYCHNSSLCVDHDPCVNATHSTVSCDNWQPSQVDCRATDDFADDVDTLSDDLAVASVGGMFWAMVFLVLLMVTLRACKCDPCKLPVPCCCNTSDGQSDRRCGVLWIAAWVVLSIALPLIVIQLREGGIRWPTEICRWSFVGVVITGEIILGIFLLYLVSGCMSFGLCMLFEKARCCRREHYTRVSV